MDDLAGQHARREIAVEGFQQRGALAHPVAQRLPGERHAMPREDLDLAIERHVVGVLGRDHLGQQPGAGAPLVDRLRGQRRGDHMALTGLARVFAAHVFDDEERGRLVVELLARLLADLHQPRAAGRARALRLRQGMLDAPPGQKRRQGLPPVAGARATGRGRRVHRIRGRGRRVHRVHPARELEHQLSRVELLGAPPIEVAPEERQLMGELVDQLLLDGQLGEQLRAELLQIGRILWKRGERGGHRTRCIVPRCGPVWLQNLAAGPGTSPYG
jgi:hypothetical protein